MTTIVVGTNRNDSRSLVLAKHYQKLLLEKGLQADILSLTQLPDMLIASDLYGKRSPEFQLIQDKVTATQKFLFIIPEYNGSFPGVLKTFIDCCKFPESFKDKKAALVGLSDGKYGNIRGIEHFSGICHYIGLHVMPMRLHIPSIAKDLDDQGNLVDESTIKFVNEQCDRFITF